MTQLLEKAFAEVSLLLEREAQCLTFAHRWNNDAAKGSSVLLLQKDGVGRPVHVVWGIPKGYNKPVVLVTAYRPDPGRWDEAFLRRR